MLGLGIITLEGGDKSIKRKSRNIQIILTKLAYLFLFLIILNVTRHKIPKKMLARSNGTSS